MREAVDFDFVFLFIFHQSHKSSYDVWANRTASHHLCVCGVERHVSLENIREMICLHYVLVSNVNRPCI